MVKPAIALFLSFCFLLLSGSSHLHLPFHSGIFIPTTAPYAAAHGNEPQAVQLKCSAFHIPTTNGATADQLDGIEPEDDDDQSESSRKYLELTSYYLHLYSAQLLGDVHLYNKAALPSSLHFAATAPMHILHRVIRV